MKMTFVGAVKSVFVNFRKFKGTATRREYWFFVLATVLIGPVLSVIEEIFWPRSSGVDVLENYGQSSLLETAYNSFLSSPLSSLATLIILIPQLAVTSRRFQDAGLSGKWLLVLLLQLPFVAGTPDFVAYVDTTPVTDLEVLYAEFPFLVPTLVAALVAQLLVFVFTLLPSKSRAQGNKYAPEA
jgi:uncharacterized membrane protein YhaH (DUF805 family)